MKIINVTVVVSAVLAAIGTSLFLLSTHMQPLGYIEVQTDAIPQNGNPVSNCTKQIRTYDPGPMGGFMCPITYFHMNTKVDNYSGFDDVCMDPRYGGDTYVLKLGHKGSIMYTLYPDLPFSYAVQVPHVNLTNHVSFSHYKPTKGGGGFTYTDTIDGVHTTFEPGSEVLFPWSSQHVTLTMYATANAKASSHWLFLSPGVCNGGLGFVLTVENSSRLEQ